MSKIYKTPQVKIVALRRNKNSYYGNPQYTIAYLVKGQEDFPCILETENDASFAYSISIGDIGTWKILYIREDRRYTYGSKIAYWESVPFDI